MSNVTFKKLATTIINNAASYKTRAACEMAIGRIKRAWSENGSYGCLKDYRDDAIFECQCRWLELKP
jgi:hypothetical protein